MSLFQFKFQIFLLHKQSVCFCSKIFFIKYIVFSLNQKCQFSIKTDRIEMRLAKPRLPDETAMEIGSIYYPGPFHFSADNLS